jgi:hypothetical protein
LENGTSFDKQQIACRHVGGNTRSKPVLSKAEVS